MSFKRQASVSQDYEMPEPGIHPATLVGLIHLGTTEQEYQGQKYDRDKILLVWELVSENDSNGIPFIVQADYTFSLNVKAALRKTLESWLGKVMPDGQEIDVLAFLGRNCMLTIQEGISGNQKKFIEVASVSPPMKGVNFPSKPHHDQFAWDFELQDSQQDEIQIPSWVLPLYGRDVREDIKKAHEWAALPAIGSTGKPAPKQTNGSTRPKPASAPVPAPTQKFEQPDMSDKAPF